MDKLFLGQKESEGWDGISTEGTNGRKTLVLPCCVYCGHSVCPGCRAVPKGLLLLVPHSLDLLLALSWYTDAIQLPSP